MTQQVTEKFTARSTAEGSGDERLPAEGAGGLFSESWFPLCKSDEVAPASIKGVDFLDGRVIVFRDSQAKAHVLSAYCPHLGADLSAGDCKQDTVRCAFHRWRYDSSGRCVATASGDPPPPRAHLFKYPTAERYGLIWAFNGTCASWQIPDLGRPDDTLEMRVEYDVPTYPVDPWVICANTPDWQHLRTVHRLQFDPLQFQDRITWTDHSMRYPLAGRYVDAKAAALDVHVGIYGTSIFTMVGEVFGRWFGSMAAFGLPRPGVTQGFIVVTTERRAGDTSESLAPLLAQTLQLGVAMTREDRPILHGIRYRPRNLTASDTVLASYLKMLRQFPRSHAGADYIR